MRAKGTNISDMPSECHGAMLVFFHGYKRWKQYHLFPPKTGCQLYPVSSNNQVGHMKNVADNYPMGRRDGVNVYKQQGKFREGLRTIVDMRFKILSQDPCYTFSGHVLPYFPQALKQDGDVDGNALSIPWGV